MTLETIRRLNQLNTTFYSQIAEDFDSTRQQSWPGWSQLVENLQQLAATMPLKVLDLGCGNGRLGEFLAENLNLSELEYTGVDTNSTLLVKAAAKLASQPVTASFKAQDVVELAVSEQLPTVFGIQSFNVITLLGLMHHLPSAKLRQDLLTQFANLLPPRGLLIFATWQFMESGRLSSKRVEPSQAGFTEAELEPNDYFLDWDRGESAYRYCHYFDEAEHRQIVNHLQSSCRLLKEFRADGKEGNLNHYFVFEKLA
jgi:tRNA (uracil-5-)-methyltransferase TRM9